MENEPIQKSDSYSDEVYNELTNEYSKYIPRNIDKIFVDLMNHITKYNKYQGRFINLIKDDLKQIDDISCLNTKVRTKYLDFKGLPEENLRLSILLPKIIKLRQLAYQKAYYLASDIILNKMSDYHLHEDFLLAYNTINELDIDNFYVDLRIYNTEQTIDRYFDECALIDLICDALSGKDISIDTIENLEHNLYKMHNKIFEYLKRRYVKSNKILEKR